MSRFDRFQNEVVAGGSVTESPDDELVGGWRGALGVLGVVGLIALLAVFNVWWFVFVVGVLIAIFFHELGHFVTARWTGMKATQFFIGFGPRLWSFRRGETEYGVRALPLGAFVRIIGMNNMDEVPEVDESRTYRHQIFPKRLLVISAGSIMHMIMAVLLLFTVYSIDGEQVERGGADINGVQPGGPAEQAGILEEDIVIAIGNTSVDSPDDLGNAVQELAPGDTVVFSLVRDGEPLSIPVTVAMNDDSTSPLEGKPYVGVASSDVFEKIDHSIGGAAVNSVTDIFPTAWESSKGVVKVLNPVNVFTHLNGTNDDLATRPTTLVGVTGLSDDVGDAAGFVGILFLLAVLNVFIGVFNMFPLLPLDGGHAAIATYERIRERDGRRYYADVSKMMPFAMAVMTVLLFLFASGLYLDITDPVG
ncbi:MAG TPA: M50 family metallopeptidase [Ilumatobacteraceae bacterium]|nr:M50 family metallopeptidase [Ilumatobacteraceae bacterium]